MKLVTWLRFINRSFSSGLLVSCLALFSLGAFAQELPEYPDLNLPPSSRQADILSAPTQATFPATSTTYPEKRELTAFQTNFINGYLSESRKELFEGLFSKENPILFPLTEKFPDRIQVTAPELCRSFSENELKAEKLYLEKPLMIFGEMDKISRNAVTKQPELFISSGPNCFKTIKATFQNPEKEIDGLAELSKGSEVSLICQGSPADGYLNLKDCSLINTALIAVDKEVRNQFFNALTGKAKTYDEMVLAAGMVGLENILTKEEKEACEKNFLTCVIYMEQIEKLAQERGISPESLLPKIEELGYTPEQIRNLLQTH